MANDETTLRDLVAAGAGFLEVFDHLSHRAGRPVGAVGLLAIIQSELGIPFVKTRAMYEYFDDEMRPLADPEVINERWQAILRDAGLLGSGPTD